MFQTTEKKRTRNDKIEGTVVTDHRKILNVWENI